MTTPLNSETALRIGVASRCLPEITLKELIDILIRATGYPLTSERLQALGFSRFTRAAQGRFDSVSRSRLGRALDYLHDTRKIAIQELPVPAPGTRMPESIRIAIASEFSDIADSWFSNCRRFLIYQVSRDDACFVGERLVESTPDRPDRAADRVRQIEDCHLLYANNIGARSVPLLIKAKIHPVTCRPGALATSLIEDLQNRLREAPPPWLAKHLSIDRQPGSSGASPSFRARM